MPGRGASTRRHASRSSWTDGESARYPRSSNLRIGRLAQPTRRVRTMPLLAIPEEFIDLRASLRDLIDREIRPREETYRQEIQETGTVEADRDERLKGRPPSAERGLRALHRPGGG